MGLLSIIRKQKVKDKEIRCLMLGLDNSGKSSIVNFMLDAEHRKKEIVPTVGFEIHHVAYEGGVNINVWDVGGQSTLRPFWGNYFDKTDVLVWCIDSSVDIRIDESVIELKNLIDLDYDRIGYDCKVVVCINKVDLIAQKETYGESVAGIQQRVQQVLSQGVSDVQQKRIDFIECSGLTGQGVPKLLDTIVATKEYRS